MNAGLKEATRDLSSNADSATKEWQGLLGEMKATNMLRTGAPKLSAASANTKRDLEASAEKAWAKATQNAKEQFKKAFASQQQAFQEALKDDAKVVADDKATIKRKKEEAAAAKATIKRKKE